METNCNVFMLSTEKATKETTLFNIDSGLHYVKLKDLETFECANLDWSPHYVYITTDRDIDEFEQGHVLESGRIKSVVRFNKGYTHLKYPMDKLIIASDNPLLNLPKPSQEFLEMYANNNGEIDDVIVEQVCASCGMNANTTKNHKMGCDYKSETRTILTPKRREDNTIIIREAKNFSIQDMRHNLRTVIGLLKEDKNFNLEIWINLNI